MNMHYNTTNLANIKSSSNVTQLEIKLPDLASLHNTLFLMIPVEIFSIINSFMMKKISVDQQQIILDHYKFFVRNYSLCHLCKINIASLSLIGSIELFGSKFEKRCCLQCIINKSYLNCHDCIEIISRPHKFYKFWYDSHSSINKEYAYHTRDYCPLCFNNHNNSEPSCINCNSTKSLIKCYHRTAFNNTSIDKKIIYFCDNCELESNYRYAVDPLLTKFNNPDDKILIEKRIRLKKIYGLIHI